MRTLFYIESLGCAKNQVDSEALIALLEQSGFHYTENIDSAHYIIVNTCGFIESAKQESIDTVLLLKQQYPQKKLLMVGCLVQRYGSELYTELTEVDGFMGNRNLGSIEAVLRDAERGIRPLAVPDDYLDVYDHGNNRSLSFPGSAYVKLAEGSGNTCSYCAIPLIRGPLCSRPLKNIVRQVETLVSSGIHEIIFIAQDLSSYGLDRGSAELVTLIKRVLESPHDFWLRLLYIHPDRFPLPLLNVVRQDPRVLPYFDLPFQHASPVVLRAMGRKGSGEEYLKLVENIRGILPDAVVRSTFLTGFPGESEEDFRMLLDFQEKAGLNWAGVFTYSREEGTAAANYKPRVKKQVARERQERLQEAQERITARWLDSFPGTELDVLIEERVEKQGMFLARGYFQAPEVDGLVVVNGDEAVPGSIARVRIIKRNGPDLEGVLC
ncbi:MAG: 30S ribosomal protein S12 methylthiotransferase RimO [Spirochaetia bacterium]